MAGVRYPRKMYRAGCRARCLQILCVPPDSTYHVVLMAVAHLSMLSALGSDDRRSAATVPQC